MVHSSPSYPHHLFLRINSSSLSRRLKFSSSAASASSSLWKKKERPSCNIKANISGPLSPHFALTSLSLFASKLPNTTINVVLLINYSSFPLRLQQGNEKKWKKPARNKKRRGLTSSSTLICHIYFLLLQNMHNSKARLSYCRSPSRYCVFQCWPEVDLFTQHRTQCKSSSAEKWKGAAEFISCVVGECYHGFLY